MAQLDNLVTNDLTGEAYNFQEYSSLSPDYGVDIKQVFNVTKNSDFTWTIVSSLYVKLSSNYPSDNPYLGTTIEGVWQQIGNDRFYRDDYIRLEPIYSAFGDEPGIYIDNVKVSSNAYEYYKVFECTKTFNCTNTGRYAVRLQCGAYRDNYDITYRHFTDYTYIYLTLPSFSSLKYKRNGSFSSSMPWIKVNGQWKRAKQYVKVNGEWKESRDTWIWNP